MWFHPWSLYSTNRGSKTARCRNQVSPRNCQPLQSESTNTQKLSASFDFSQNEMCFFWFHLFYHEKTMLHHNNRTGQNYFDSEAVVLWYQLKTCVVLKFGNRHPVPWWVCHLVRSLGSPVSAHNGSACKFLKQVKQTLYIVGFKSRVVSTNSFSPHICSSELYLWCNVSVEAGFPCLWRVGFRTFDLTFASSSYFPFIFVPPLKAPLTLIFF